MSQPPRPNIVHGAFLAIAMRWTDRLIGLVSTLIRREFSFQGFGNLRETSINLLGAILLGVGSVLAMGCTVGHGFSGIATLAVGSMLAMAAIVFGTWVALRVETALARQPAAICR